MKANINHKHKAGRIGGLKTVERHGTEHMRAIGKRGAKTFWKRYSVKPAGTSGWVILHRETQQVVNFIGSLPFTARQP